MPCRPAWTLSPASRSTRSSPATSGCGRASCTSSVSGWIPTTPLRGRPSPPSAAVAGSGSRRPSPGCASSTSRSTSRSPTSPPPTTTRSAADRRPGAIDAGHATSVDDAFRRLLGLGQARRTCRARGLARSRRSSAIRAAGGLPVAGAFRRGAARVEVVRELVEPGSAGSRSTTARSTRRPSSRSERSPSALGLVATGGSDYHGDTGTYAEAHAGCGSRPRSRPDWSSLASGRRRRRLAGTAMTDRSTPTTRALPMLDIVRPSPDAPRSRPRPPTTASPNTCPRPGRCRASTSGRSAAR